MTITYLITGGTTPDGVQTDIAIDSDGVIAELGQNLRAEESVVIDATNKIVLPGLVDLHTHLREPGNNDAETVESGTRAAAKGG
ncbi:MAG: amidohydrolase family protein, partial [Yaniella sp.]|nr:amidohydrolase family protein [Yaniella sp.]